MNIIITPIQHHQVFSPSRCYHTCARVMTCTFPTNHAQCKCLSVCTRCELLECIASAHYISKSPLFYRCSMALVHSRIRRVYYCYRTVCGALNTAFKLHTANGLNHHFQAFEVITDSWNLWKWYCVLSCDDVDRNFAIYCKNIYKSRNGYELLLSAGSYLVVNDMSHGYGLQR